MGAFISTTKKPIRPLTVPTDTVIPLHPLDVLPHTRAISLDFTFRFDDVLDIEKLRAALARLLEIGDWRKLGGRIRLNVGLAPISTRAVLFWADECGGSQETTRKFEYHIPANFDANRPGFEFTSAEYDMDLSDHPTASRLRKPDGERLCVLDGLGDVNGMLRGPSPSKLDDYLYSDRPQLAVHTVSFRDSPWSRSHSCIRWRMLWAYRVSSTRGKQFSVVGKTRSQPS